MTTPRTAKDVVRGCTILALTASSSLGSTALGADAVKQLLQTLPTAVAGSFVIHFDQLPAGQQVSDVSLNQGVSGFSTGELPLTALGASRVRVQAQRLDREGDSNRAMIYNAECGGNAESCSGNDGDDLEIAIGAFGFLLTSIEQCIEAGVFVGDPVSLGTRLWASAHGVASLLIAKPTFPWPDRDQFIADTVEA